MRQLICATLFVANLFFLGCTESSSKPNPVATAPKVPSDEEINEVAAERAKLSVEDRLLVDAQEWCVISTDEKLGSMGPPIKLDIQGQPVFVCCKGCTKKAESNPEKTLKTLSELKAKKAATSKQDS